MPILSRICAPPSALLLPQKRQRNHENVRDEDRLSRVGHIDELVQLILRSASHSVLCNCLRVSRLFRDIAMRRISTDYRNMGLRRVLYLTLSTRPVNNSLALAIEHARRVFKLYATLNRADLQLFKYCFAPHLRHLTWDTSSLSPSSKLVAQLLGTFSELYIDLPRLETLHVSIRQEKTEIELAQRLLQPNVMAFTLDVLFAPLPTKRKWPMIRRSRAPTDIVPESDLRRARAAQQWSLQDLFQEIAAKTPGLIQLGVYVRDDKQMALHWSSFISMLGKLSHLKTLQLPPGALPPQLASRVCDHPTLRHILSLRVSGEESPLSVGFAYTAVLRHAWWPGSNIPSTLTRISMTIEPQMLLEFLQETREISRITHLEVFLRSPLLPDMSPALIFEKIAAACPELEALRVGPFVSCHWQDVEVTDADTAPLMQCPRFQRYETLIREQPLGNEDRPTNYISDWYKICGSGVCRRR